MLNEKAHFLINFKIGRWGLRKKLMIGAMFFSFFILSYVARD